MPPCFALCDLVGNVRQRWHVHPDQSGQMRAEDIRRGIQRAQDYAQPWQASRLLATGVCYPGIMEPQGRVTAVDLGWTDVPLADEVTENLSTPVFFENDSRISVMAERLYGAARGSGNFIFLEIGRGIGIGAFTDGRHVSGRDGMAGEFGHMTIDPHAADLCRCGKRGCLEAIASATHIVRQYCERAGFASAGAAVVGVEHVLAEARLGRQPALAVIDRAGAALGLGISYLVHLFNPELIVIGGGLAAGLDLLLPRIEAQLRIHALPSMIRNLRILASELGGDVRLRGAAGAAFLGCLSEPSLLRKLCSPLRSRFDMLGSARTPAHIT